MKRIFVSVIISFCIVGGLIYSILNLSSTDEYMENVESKLSGNANSIKTARIVANGDILIHDALYFTAQKSDGVYDFDEFFKYVKPWIEGADLAIGDFEGTISDKHPLGGYPLFNAPIEIADTIKNVGYDVVDLAHNHILDTGLYGLKYTANAFYTRGIDVVGVHTKTKRENSDLVIKEVNGIKIAILAYSYGYNDMDKAITREEYNNYLSDLDEEKMKAEIQRAEKEADVTVVLPQMGVEYSLEATIEQKKLYHKMVSWGADVIFGGHPHVIEPTETIEKDGEKKFIVYSMGNFISNQRKERMVDVQNGQWAERGLLMDVTFEKNNDRTVIKMVKAHPTLVYASLNGRLSPKGASLYDYRVLVLEDFIEGGRYRDELDSEMKEKVDLVYKEVNAHVDLNW